MLFSDDAIAGLADGSITLTFRRWKKPQARTGGRYRVRGLLLEATDVRTVHVDEITDTEARRAGADSAAAAIARLGPGLAPNESVWRVELRCIGEDDRIVRRVVTELDADQRAAIQARLDRMDRSGAWTTRTLRLIATYPGVVSTTLARQLGFDRPAFKLNVRKLKDLGLTESLEIGYRLSPLGKAFLGLDDERD